ncbi:MAG: ABC transporter permease [Gemmatimonadaceae bacterium]
MTEALLALWDGAFGSSYAIWSATLVRSAPLLLLGLGVALAFRAGVLNIGAEGQFLMGAISATAVAQGVGGTWPSVVMIPAMAVVGALAGAGWAGIAAWLRHRFGVLEVISTIMLNFIALATISWMVRGPLQEPTRIYPQSAEIPHAAQWPFLIPGQRLHLGFVLGLLACVIAWVVLTRTTTGFRIRAVGASPSAATSAGGIDVARTVTRVFLVSGACAGLAGAAEVGGVTWALYEGISPGYGYTAIAVALLARLHPGWIIGTAIFFGALEAGASAMQRDAGIPSVVVQVIVAVIILGVLAGSQRRARATGGRR